MELRQKQVLPNVRPPTWQNLGTFALGQTGKCLVGREIRDLCCAKTGRFCHEKRVLFGGGKTPTEGERIKAEKLANRDRKGPEG